MFWWRKTAPEAATGSSIGGNGGKAKRDVEIPTVDTWRDENTQLEVAQKPGFACSISMRSKVDLPPDELFDVLTHPRNDLIFRGIKNTRQRRVLKKGPHGRQEVEVVQEGRWRFLLFSGSFVTKLLVVEDRRAHTIDFRQVGPGFMRRFEGRWRIDPFTNETLDEMYDKGHAHPWLALRKARASLEHSLGIRRPRASLATLEQDVMPSVVPPGMEYIIRGIAAKAVTNVVGDIQLAARRINAGQLQWPPPPSGDGS